MSGRKFNPALTYPTYGSVVSHTRASRAICRRSCSWAATSTGASAAAPSGFLGMEHNPFELLADPNAGQFAVRDISPPAGIELARVERRRGMLAQIDALQRKADLQPAAFEALDEHYQAALNMITSPDTKRAFELEHEDPRLRDRYGRHKFGQSCLLARRLIEAGVRFVTVTDGGWDTHQNNFTSLKNSCCRRSTRRCRRCWSTWRSAACWTPRWWSGSPISAARRRSTPPAAATTGPPPASPSWPAPASPAARCSAPTDDEGGRPIRDEYKSEDIAATIYAKLGIPLDLIAHSPDGRPLRLLEDGPPHPRVDVAFTLEPRRPARRVGLRLSFVFTGVPAMLNLWGKQLSNDCEGHNRREFLKVGAAGHDRAGSVRPVARAGPAASTGRSSERHLGRLDLAGRRADAHRDLRSQDGGPGRVPQRGRRRRHRRARRAVRHALCRRWPRWPTGWPFVRSFAHGNSGHAGGTHYVMTGVDHPPADAACRRSSLRSARSPPRCAGRTTRNRHPDLRSPLRLYADGPHWLGAAHAPFDVGGQAQQQHEPGGRPEPPGRSPALLGGLDRLNRQVDRSGLMDGLDAFEGQAFDLILGRAKEAFDLSREDPAHARPLRLGRPRAGRAVAPPGGCARRAAAS